MPRPEAANTATEGSRGSQLRQRLPPMMRQVLNPSQGPAVGPVPTPPRCPPSSGTELSQDLMEVDPCDADLRLAVTSAEPAPVAGSQSTGDRPPAPQAGSQTPSPRRGALGPNHS